MKNSNDLKQPLQQVVSQTKKSTFLDKVAMKLLVKRKLVITTLVVLTFLLSIGFIGLLGMQQLSILRDYNTHIDRARIALEKNDLDKVTQELSESRNIVLNSRFLHRLKRTELWLLEEMVQLYEEQEEPFYEQNEEVLIIEQKDQDPVAPRKNNPTRTKEPDYSLTPMPVEKETIQQEVSEGYTENNTYPIIREFSDNLGSVIKRSSYNGYTGAHTSPSSGKTVKVGDKITWSVKATDPNGRAIKYNFNSNSQRLNDDFGRGEYKSNSQYTYQLTQDDLSSSGELLRIVVQIRSEKENYRFSGEYDDSIYLDYTFIK